MRVGARLLPLRNGHGYLFSSRASSSRHQVQCEARRAPPTGGPRRPRVVARVVDQSHRPLPGRGLGNPAGRPAGTAVPAPPHPGPPVQDPRGRLEPGSRKLRRQNTRKAPGIRPRPAAAPARGTARTRRPPRLDLRGDQDPLVQRLESHLDVHRGTLLDREDRLAELLGGDQVEFGLALSPRAGGSDRSPGCCRRRAGCETRRRILAPLDCTRVGVVYLTHVAINEEQNY